MKIQLIRHCETEWNRLERCQGISDLELNNNGINQSIFLKDFYSDKHVDLIFSSDLKRTMQTALEINKNLKSDIIQNEKLREMDIQMIGDIFYVSYNSPYKVFNRRNEVMVEIEYVVEKN